MVPYFCIVGNFIYTSAHGSDGVYFLLWGTAEVRYRACCGGAGEEQRASRCQGEPEASPGGVTKRRSVGREFRVIVASEKKKSPYHLSARKEVAPESRTRGNVHSHAQPYLAEVPGVISLCPGRYPQDATVTTWHDGE